MDGTTEGFVVIRSHYTKQLLHAGLLVQAVLMELLEVAVRSGEVHDGRSVEIFDNFQMNLVRHSHELRCACPGRGDRSRFLVIDNGLRIVICAQLEQVYRKEIAIAQSYRLVPISVSWTFSWPFRLRVPRPSSRSL
jgi:hypothetical protein